MLGSAEDRACGAGDEALGEERVVEHLWRALRRRAAAVRRWFGEAPVCTDESIGGTADDGTADDGTEVLDEMAIW